MQFPVFADNVTIKGDGTVFDPLIAQAGALSVAQIDGSATLLTPSVGGTQAETAIIETAGIVIPAGTHKVLVTGYLAINNNNSDNRTRIRLGAGVAGAIGAGGINGAGATAIIASVNCVFTIVGPVANQRFTLTYETFDGGGSTFDSGSLGAVMVN